MLGDNIKKIRKQKKLTLEQLAGTQMTKGMLSLIENNKAKPSLENLEYIASKLEITVSELLTDASSSQLRETVNEIELIEDPYFILDESMRNEILEKIKSNLTLIGVNYESARLCQMYAVCLYYEKNEEYVHYFKQSISIYEQLNMTSKQIEIQIQLINIDFLKRKFTNAYDSIKKLYTTMDQIYALVEPISRLEVAFHYAAFAFSLGKLEEGYSIIDEALKFSSRTQVFYYIGDLYRLAATCDIIFNKKQNSPYLTKLKLYGEFADDIKCKNAIELLEIYTKIENMHQYEDGLVHAVQEIAKLEYMIELYKEKDKNISRSSIIILPYFKMLKGGALLYLNRNIEAIETLLEVTFLDEVNFPLDIDKANLTNYYLARAYLNIGQKDTAHKIIKDALERISIYPYMETRELLENLLKEAGTKL